MRLTQEKTANTLNDEERQEKTASARMMMKARRMMKNA